jgi:hypothetical protein
MPTRFSSGRRSSRGIEPVAIALLVVTSMGLAGCSARICNPPRTNIVMAGKQGEPIDPATYKQLPEAGEKRRKALGAAETYDQYIDRIFAGIVAYCDEKHLSPCPVLLFFHGGLDGQAATVDRAAQQYQEIEKAGFYPIFVNWKASLSSTYWDHLAHIHKGYYYKHLTVPLVPYVFAVDEGKSIVDAPSTWGTEARHTFTHERLYQATTAYGTLLGRRQAEGEKAIELNNLLLACEPASDRRCPPNEETLADQRSFYDIWGPRAAVMITFWSKILTLPLVVAAGGPGAWSVLERRTGTLFRTEGEFRGKERAEIDSEKQTTANSGAATPPPDDTEGAALAHFIDRFQGGQGFVQQLCESGRYDPQKQAAGPKVDLPLLKTEAKGAGQDDKAAAKACKRPLEITLVGHSMGAIIIDRLLRYAPTLEVKNIVFMAAATTLEDYKDTIDPYLAAHPATQMYHLMLHPTAELTERHFLDLSPRGSLLVWLDNFFTDPADPLGRRVGRFSNLLPELTFTPDDIRGQIHVKVFRVGTQVSCWSPQQHGDFPDFPFWDANFWYPSVDSQGGTSPRRLDGANCPGPAPAVQKKPQETAPLTAPAAPSAAWRR